MVKTKYWATLKEVWEKLDKFCDENKATKVLEIGPGICPFPRSTHFVGFNEKLPNVTEVDIDEEKLPFEDKEFDFLYCRHTLEDIQNPRFALQEMIRVSKAGYIETPSPLVEISKGVDAHTMSDLFGGYLHHRYIVWSNIDKNEVHFLPKYGSFIDQLMYITSSTQYQADNILENPFYWNNYFYWTESKDPPKIFMYKNGVQMKDLINEYPAYVNRAINECIKNTEYFFLQPML